MRSPGKWMSSGYWSRAASLPKQQSANDLRPQSVKVINCLSCTLWYVNKVFCYIPPHLYLGIKTYGKERRATSVFTGSPSHTILWFLFCHFHVSSYSLLLFQNSHDPSFQEVFLSGLAHKNLLEMTRSLHP